MKELIIITTIITLITISILISITYYLFHFCFNPLTEKKLKKFNARHNPNTQKRLILKEQLLAKNPQVFKIKSKKNSTLVAYYFKQRENNKKLVILSHGWRSDALRDLCSYGEFYFNHPEFDILVINHEGHFPSEGKYICFGITDGENIKLWIDYINNELSNQYDIYLHGVSMGASSCLYACKHNLPKNVKAIVADCGFVSGYSQLKYLLNRKYYVLSFPALPFVNGIVKHRLKIDIRKDITYDAMNKDNIPILFIHGDKDDFVPTYMSEINYDKYNGPKELIIVEGAKHSRSYITDKEKYESSILRFYEKYDTFN